MSGARIPVFHGEVGAGAPHAGESPFVSDQQDAAPVAEAAQLGEEVVRREDGAGPALHRLQHERGDVPGGGVGDEVVEELDVGVGVDGAVRLEERGGAAAALVEALRPPGAVGGFISPGSPRAPSCRKST